MDPTTRFLGLPERQPPPPPPATQLPTPGNPAETKPYTPLPDLDGTQSTPLISPGELPPAPLRPGTVVDGYAILECLGRGGMGVVYKARQPQTGQVVALKMVRDGVFADAGAVERFLREVRGLGRVQPAKNIVPIYLVGQHQDQPYFVMPLLPGGTLADYRQHGDPGKIVAAVEKIARAVQHLHAHGLLHRDLKPGNILLNAEGEPFLCDFGLIKLLDEDHTLTRPHQRMGTPAYMAPEQTGLVATPVSPQTDIWALGVLLYELLTGSRPFTSVSKDESATLLWKIVNEVPPPPGAVKPDLDPGLEAVILKCLEKNPLERYASADALADELARWLRQEKLQTRRAPLRRFLYRHRRVAAALVFFAVIAAVTAVGWYRTTPVFVLESLRAELLENGQVVLIPEKGRPRWQALAIDNPVNTFFDETEGVWIIRTWEVGLVELLRDIPLESYKLRAEIRHQESDPRSGQYQGHAGIFIGHQAKSADPKTPHLCCNLIYNDQVDERPPKPLPGAPTANVARLKYRLFADTGIAPPIDELQGWTKAAQFQCAGRVDSRRVPWRVLEMELHPDQIVCSFDGQAMPPLARAYADQRFQAALRERQIQYPAKFGPLGDVTHLKLSPRGSLGLVVSKGAIAVKSVTVSRIPKKNPGE